MDKKICFKGLCLAQVMILNSDPVGQFFLSLPHDHVGHSFLHTLFWLTRHLFFISCD